LLIDEIIQLLSSDKGSITEALLKTKVLLHQIGPRELIEWVNDELNGYREGKEVPPYRILPAQVRGNLVYIRARYTSHPIPVGHLTEEERQTLESLAVRDSLAVVLQLSESENSISRPLPLEYSAYLGKGLSPGTHVEQAWCAISQFQFGNIVFQVRSRLLDFMLELKGSFGGASSEAEIRQKTSTVDTKAMFNNAVFGPNATVIVGSNNTQVVDTTIIQGDFNSLSKYLKSLGVDDAAIDELRAAADAKATVDQSSLKKKVVSWIKKQVTKQMDGEAQSLLTFSVDATIHAVRAYFGF
jgi:hypothetical protein